MIVLTRAGLAVAAVTGPEGGRLSKVDDVGAAKACQLKDEGINAADIAKMLDVSVRPLRMTPNQPDVLDAHGQTEADR